VRRIAPVLKLIESCNLACSYCYQEELLARRRLMAPATLDRILAELARITTGPLQLLWFGGEPTLVGLRYFRAALEAAHRHFAGRSLRHAIQTNATLIDEAWATLLAEHRFSVTVSLDGPADLHDACRTHRNGQGTHERIMAALHAMAQHGLRARASCVVTPATLPHAARLVDYFASLDLLEVDFPPAMRFVGGQCELLVTPQQYGEFMVTVLERWLGLGRTDFRVRSLAGLARSMSGMPPMFCKLEGSCEQYATFAWNGDVYPCDEFSGIEGHRLGNVLEAPLDEMLSSPLARSIHQRWNTLPAECHACEWRDLCRGGCPFERRVGGGVDQKSAVCEGLKMLYARMAQELS
jgi:uncharacterized protein